VDSPTTGGPNAGEPEFIAMSASTLDGRPAAPVEITLHPRYRSLLGHKAPTLRRPRADDPGAGA
jgi:hypothetical protein